MTYSEKLQDPRWQKKRLQILKRDDFSCQLCGDTKSTLHVHHLSYGKDPWSINNNLLITLCKNCHYNEEIELKEQSQNLIKELKNAGFMSNSFNNLSKVFKDTNRDWNNYDPSFDIIKMIIDDHDLWDKMHDLYFRKLINK